MNVLENAYLAHSIASNIPVKYGKLIAWIKSYAKAHLVRKLLACNRTITAPKNELLTRFGTLVCWLM